MKLYIFLLIVFALTHCSSGGEELAPSADPVDRNRALVETVSQRIIPFENQKLASYAMTLDQLATKACGEESASVADLRKAWWDVMGQFHKLDVIAYGPLSDNKNALRDQIYSWPLTINTSSIDTQMTRAHEKQDQYKFRSDSFSIIGLDALEYILFAVLPEDGEVTKDMEACPYLSLAAADVFAASVKLNKDFQANEVLQTKGEKTSEDYNQVISRMVQALQFFEDSIKERKLGLPLDLIEVEDGPSCDLGVDCHEYLEHPFAKISRRAVLKNLEGFASVYYGTTSKGDEFGFRDYIIEAGFQDEIRKVDQAIVDTKNVLDLLPEGDQFVEMVKNFNSDDCGQTALCEAYQKSVVIADWIKGDFILQMSKDLPIGVQGDND